LSKNPARNIYSLDHDRRINKELIENQRNKLLDKVDFQKVSINLHSNDEQERLNAVKTLSYLPGNRFIPLIETLLLNDLSAEVRGKCAIALQILDSKSSISSLILALNDQDRNVRIYSILALAALGEKEKCSAALDLLWNNGISEAPFYSCHIAFRDLDTPDAINNLIFDLDNKDKYIAIDAAIILAQLGHSKEAFPFLEQSLYHDDKYIRMAALSGLAYIGDQKSLELIHLRINDPDNLVKERANSIIKNFDIKN
jgi:HEAT repeat protein